MLLYILAYAMNTRTSNSDDFKMSSLNDMNLIIDEELIVF